MPFLVNFPLRQIQPKESHNQKIDGLILGQCAQALEGDDEGGVEVEDDGYPVL